MSDKLDKFFAVARQARPDTTRVEYGFETRLLARLRAERAQETPWLVWTWRLMPVFAVFVLGLGIWRYATPDPGDFHAAIVGQTSETALVTYLTGE